MPPAAETRQYLAAGERERPAWWDSDIGVSDIVLPGFTPLQYEGSTIKLFARRYDWGNGYLPREIMSRDRSMAQAMRFVATVAGRQIALAPSTIEFTAANPDHAVVVGHGQTIPGLTVVTETRVEYDGVAMVTVRLTPEHPITIDGLDFEVDLESSPALRVIGFRADGIRKQKDRRDMITLPYAGDFINVLGFADGQRSFWWFADDAAGWVGGREDVTSIRQHDGRITLRQRLIGRTWTIDRPLELRFNFLATPVRDLGTAWRDDRVVLGSPGRKSRRLNEKFKLWWPTAFAHDTLPYTDYPPGVIEKLGPKDIAAYPGLDANRDLIRNDLERFGVHWIPYFSAHALSTLDPAVARYRTEWEVSPPWVFRGGVAPYSPETEKPSMSHRARSYSNYLLWRLSEEIDRLGMSGIYLDHGVPFDSRNVAHGPRTGLNGTSHPSLDILGTRAFLKRLRTLFNSKGKPGYVFVHASNREIVPAFTFAWALVDGEQYRSRVPDGDYVPLLDLDEFRTRFVADQYGILTYWLAQAWSSHIDDASWNASEAQRRAYRNMMTLALLHDLPVWPVGAHREERSKLVTDLDEFGIARSQFEGYWVSDNGVSANRKDIKVSVYRHHEAARALLVVGNLSSREQDATVKPNVTKLGLKTLDRIRVQTACHSNTTQLTAEEFTVAVPPKDFCTVMLGPNL